jgi:hypothetical protein
MSMAGELIWYIRFLGVLSLVTAAVLVALAFRGYRKTRSRALLSGALGFLMIGTGALIEGILFEFVSFPFENAHAVGATFTATGLLMLLYSIYRTT